MITSMIATIMAAKSEREEFKFKCALMTQEQAKEAKQLRADRLREEDQHRKALEIAEAGRARNFWGN